MTTATIDHRPVLGDAFGSIQNIENGRIIIPRSQREIEATIRRWRAQGVQPVAHDLESAASNAAPNGTGLHAHLGYIRLAQFAVADGGNGVPEAIVIDVWKHNPASFYELLTDPEWPIIVHFAQMEQRFHGWCFGIGITNLIDTWHVSKLLYPLELDPLTGEPFFDEEKGKEVKAKHNLMVASKRYLNYEMDKSCQNSAWDALKLTPEQEHYAGIDVLSLLDLWALVEPYLTDGMRVEMEEKAVARVLKSCAPAESDDPDVLTQATPHDESERAITMIKAARTKTELGEVERSIPHLRIHFHNRKRVELSLARAKGRHRRGTKPEKPVLVKISGWRRPF